MKNNPPLWRQCADLAANGIGPKEIAHTLNKSVKTVEGHLATAKRKLGIKGWGQGPFILAAAAEDRKRLAQMDERLAMIQEHLKLALDILIRAVGK